MSLQTAPGEILFTITAADDSKMELSSLSDNLVGYNVTELAGTPVVAVPSQAKLTISRRAATAQTGATKFNVKLNHPKYDVLGKLSANMLISLDVVVPNAFMADYASDIDANIETIAQFITLDLFKGMCGDGTFLR